MRNETIRDLPRWSMPKAESKVNVVLSVETDWIVLISVCDARNLLGAITTSSPTCQSTGSIRLKEVLPAMADEVRRVQDMALALP